MSISCSGNAPNSRPGLGVLHGNLAWLNLVPFSLVWSVWLFRNEIVFKKKVMDWLQLELLIKLRLASWFKVKYPDCVISLDELMSDFSLVSSSSSWNHLPVSPARWCPPPTGFLKLNTDVALLSNVSGGVGGLLRNNKGDVLFEFSESTNIAPPAVLEFEAMDRGIRKFLNSPWAKNSRLIVESDCQVAVDWCLEKVAPPVPFRERILNLAALARTRGICFRWIARSCNIKADKLAKQGIG
ncbi:hypothetical protein like AT2G34320 [Hibiscus trionum]|uniref:RNase H type-1 domain-containing protein n=1 Tax=Hibiscus trionum TaxID=183268 RepID=A0A9W7LZJ1_HIBTR|nr:hypothetical protein like AT2G34320 [Hibiscus trionum]